MSIKVNIVPSGKQFEIDTGVSILDGALKQHISLPHSCKSGDCGTCKAKLIRGKVQSENSTALSEQEINDGFILTCLSRAQSDVILESAYYPQLDGISAAIFPCKVSSIEFPADDVAIIHLRFPPNAQLKFLPGQYVNLMWKGLQRSYSIANACVTYDGLELHIRHVPNGEFSQLIFNELKLQTLVRIQGPHGSFFLREGTAPIIMLAGGTGFAPVKALVEEIIEKKIQRQVDIYWGATSASGLYSDLPTHWQSSFPNIRYVPVISGDDAAWTGRRGWVHQAVLEDFDDIGRHEVYACGSNAMIKAAKSDFIQRGLNEANFYSDAFTPFKSSP